MNRNEKKTEYKKGALARAFTLLIISFVLMAASLGTYAWFTYRKRAAGIAEISDPTAIFIKAGSGEDIRYLNLGGIDVETADDYKDFVFCVKGNHVSRYKIQLAYTTNNQFDYEIYKATEVSSSGAVPSDPESVVVYDLHDGSDSVRYYYAASGAAPIAGNFLNLDTGASEKTALTGDEYHDRTYTPTGADSVYLHRHIYAIPLYWQSRNAVSPVMDENMDFCDYYILRVKWDGSSKNDKETDIVYISAKNVSAD